MMQVPVPQQRGSCMVLSPGGLVGGKTMDEIKHPEVALGRMRLCTGLMTAFVPNAIEIATRCLNP